MKVKKLEINENLLNNSIKEDELEVIKGGFALRGEPLPGAEITIEQEPDGGCPL